MDVEEEESQNIINDEANGPKEAFIPTDESLSNSNCFIPTKMKSLSDSSNFHPQIEKVNGNKMSEDGGDEEDVDLEQHDISLSSSSDDSSASSDGSSSSSDEETNTTNRNTWSSSVTHTGIKISTKVSSECNYSENISYDSDNSNRGRKPSLSEEVKSSRLSDDSSSSDSINDNSVSPVNAPKSANSVCNNSNSLQNSFSNLNQSLVVNHPQSINFIGSISNLNSNLSSCQPENSNSESSSSSIVKNNRRSSDSISSHPSPIKSNDFVFERKLSLSSDSSDSENSGDDAAFKSVKNKVNPSIDSNSFSNDLSNGSKHSISSPLKSDSKSDKVSASSNSTCVVFNNIHANRSPERKLTSPNQDIVHSSSSSDGFSIVEKSEANELSESIIKETENEISTSPDQNSRPFQIPNSSHENVVEKSSKNMGIINVSAEDPAENNHNIHPSNQNIDNKNDPSDPKFTSSSTSSLSNVEIDRLDDNSTDASNTVASNSVDSKLEVSAKDIASVTSERFENENQRIDDTSFSISNSVSNSQEMDVDLSSGSSDDSLSSDESDNEATESQSKDLSDLSFESRNKENEPGESLMDVMKIIGGDLDMEVINPSEKSSASHSPKAAEDLLSNKKPTSILDTEESRVNCLSDDKNDSHTSSDEVPNAPISSAVKAAASTFSSEKMDVDDDSLESEEVPKANCSTPDKQEEPSETEINKVIGAELENVQSSDNILSIISKDLKSNRKLISSPKKLLIKSKKSSVKLKKKLLMLKNSIPEKYVSNTPTQAILPKADKAAEPRLTEYAQYLGLQPTLKFKCCICAQIGFQSYSELREHQKNCQSTEASKSSENRTSLCNEPNVAVSLPCPNAEDINQTNFRITRKVYLCTACGTYYENWNLFLHMREVHKRHICLLCLNMFTMSYKLSDHLILSHGIEVKSFQTLTDFRKAFNCSLYISCTDCGRIFSESDGWSTHQCLFTCNVCNIKNGHLPRCPRNFFLKADESHGASVTKPPPKCIIKINPSSGCTTILPKADEKSYDFASSLCSVDMTDGEQNLSSSEVSDSEKFESSSNASQVSKTEDKQNPETSLPSESKESNITRTSSCNANKQSSSEQNKSRNSPSNTTVHSASSEESEAQESEIERNESNNVNASATVTDEKDNSGVGPRSEINMSSGDSTGSLQIPLCKETTSKDEKVESTNESADTSIMDDIDSNTQAENSIKMPSGDSCEEQNKCKDSDKPAHDMKSISNSVFKDFSKPITNLNENENKVDSKAPSLNTNLEENNSDDNKQSRFDSSVFDPEDTSVAEPSQSIDENPDGLAGCNHSNDRNSEIADIIGTKPRQEEEVMNFKNLWKPESKNNNGSIVDLEKESITSNRTLEAESTKFGTSVDSRASFSKDSVMDYESDSQPATNDGGGSSRGADNLEENVSSLPSNGTCDSDSNRLSMAVDNYDKDNDLTTDSKLSLNDNPTDEKMMIDYDGDNAVDNADAVGQSEYNSYQKDPNKQSPTKLVVNSDGIVLASEDVPSLTLCMNGLLESLNLNTIIKECVRTSCTACAYCNHALKIAVNGRQLVLHLLAEHRFIPTRTEDSFEKLVTTLKSGLKSLEDVYFNTDSYDSSDKSSNTSYDGTFSCFQCPYWTLQHKDLYTHKRKMHQKTILLCVMCKSNFYSYSELLCHMCPGMYQPNDILFRCCFCHIDKIPSAFRLMVHIRKIHHTCEICLDVSTDQQKLATHMWKHKLHHLCYRCGIAYRNKPDITRHLFWKHGTESVLCKKCLQKKWPHVYHFCIPPSTFICEECNATFTRTVALRVHKRLHTDEKPYACTQCEEKFISRKILAKHEISHTVQEEKKSLAEVEMKENIDSSTSNVLLRVTDVPVQIQKTDEKQNIDVDDDVVVPVVRIKKNKTKKAPKPMLDLTDLPPLNLSSESDSEPEAEKPKPVISTPEVKSEAESTPLPENCEMKENLTEESNETKENVVEITNSQRLEIILADHDYCKPEPDNKESVSDSKDNKLDSSLVSLNNSLNSTVDTKEVSQSDSSPTKQKSRSPKKKLNRSNRSSNSSSSSSSSDSDSSSCSCGPNCSCSSSSSDSSTSTSSDSDSSSPENRRKQEERRQKRRERDKSDKTKSPRIDVTEPANPEPIISVENEEPIILESDLDTDVTLTDEDFYDEYPQQHANKLLEEKQQSEDQLMLLASVAPTHTAPSSPVSVSAEEPPPAHSVQPVAESPTSFPKVKKRLKTKRKRAENSVPVCSPLSIESPFESKLSQLPSTPSLITKLPNPNAKNYMSSMSASATPSSEHFSDRTHSTGGSGSESESKRSSKRRRTKNKFYGYSSEEENRRMEENRPRVKVKKLKKVIAVPKASKPDLHQSNFQHYTTATVVQAPAPPVYQPPSIIIKPILPSVSNINRSTLPIQPRPPSPFSSSDSDDDKLNIDEKDSEPVLPPPSLIPPQLPPHQPEAQKNASLYCYCQCPYDEVSEMIACDGDSCKIEWFHFECVGIMVPPKGQWFCPDCRKKKNLSY